jgi:hypothetical protein
LVPLFKFLTGTLFLNKSVTDSFSRENAITEEPELYENAFHTQVCQLSLQFLLKEQGKFNSILALHFWKCLYDILVYSKEYTFPILSAYNSMMEDITFNAIN